MRRLQNSKNLITGSKMVALVDIQGTQIGTANVFAAHQHPPQLHAASSVWLWRQAPPAPDQPTPPTTSTIEVLFQQRSANKPIGAHWWGNTVCGNVKPNESYEDCANRRLGDELNIQPSTIQLTPLYTFIYKAYGNQEFSEYEFDQMYTAQFKNPSLTNQPITPNPNEVSQTAWLPIAQLISWANQLSFPTAEESVSQNWTGLKNTTKPQTFHFQKNTYVIAPWIIFMLRDSRLQAFFKSALLS